MKVVKNENKYKTSLATLEKQLGRKERIVDDLQNLQAKKEKELKKLLNQKSDVEKENINLKERVKSLEAQVKQLNSTVRSQQDEIANLQAFLKVNMDQLSVEKENISTQTEEVQNYQVIAEQLHRELVKVKNELLEMNKSNRNLRSEQKILKSMTELGIIGR